MTASQEWCGNPNAKPLMADGIGIAIVSPSILVSAEKMILGLPHHDHIHDRNR